MNQADERRALAMGRLVLLLNQCSCEDLEVVADVIRDELLPLSRKLDWPQLRVVLSMTPAADSQAGGGRKQA